jgi:hypothetical protein
VKSIEKLLNTISGNEITAINIAEKLDAQGRRGITFSKEQVAPLRMESPPKNHLFTEAESFCGYLTGLDVKDVVLFVDIDNIQARAVLNDKAQYGFEVITFRPAAHPMFKMLSPLIGTTTHVTEFAELLLRNRKAFEIGEDNGRSLALAMQQITVSEKIEKKIGTGRDCINGVMCHTKVSAGQEGLPSPIEIPEVIRFKLPLYINTDPVEFDVDFTVIVKHGEVYIQTDSAMLELKQYEVFEAMIAPAGQIDGIHAVYGRPAWGEWNYINSR